MRNPITGEEILFAPNRAGRPNAFGGADVEVCPFCPGNESLTPPAIETVGVPWRVRVFPNKYPSVEGHEVIVESPRHHDEFDSIGHAEEVVLTWQRRYEAHADGAYVSIFKNSGERGGASIHHVHSQVMPLQFVPPRIVREAVAFTKGCPLCERPKFVIRENDSWICFAPEGASFAYQQWVAPKRHFRSIAREDLRGLAEILTASVAATRRLAAAHNLLLMNFPSQSAGHFYVDLFPRMTAIAGFELATGTFIDIIDPAAAVRALR